jgi:hypothetical protein
MVAMSLDAGTLGTASKKRASGAPLALRRTYEEALESLRAAAPPVLPVCAMRL